MLAPEKYHENANTLMRSMTTVDLAFHNGELYIAGISNEEFASTLRRVPCPFTDRMAEWQRRFHDAHAQYETRVPIRAMTFETVDGKDTLVAAYACSMVPPRCARGEAAPRAFSARLDLAGAVTIVSKERRDAADRRESCAYRKSHPAILTVQPAQDRAADDIANPLNAARDRGILVQ
jgi:hypothetical protein